VAVTNVYALYARETGHGMTFDVEGGTAGAKPGVQTKGELEPVSANTKPTAALPAPTTHEPPKKPTGGGKPTLRRIK